MPKATYYITFGQRSPFRHGWVEIMASAKRYAEDEAHNCFGPHWSMIYDKEPDRDLFPAGKLGETLQGY